MQKTINTVIRKEIRQILDINNESVGSYMRQ